MLEKNDYIASYNVAYDEEIYQRAEYERGYAYNY